MACPPPTKARPTAQAPAAARLTHSSVLHGSHRATDGPSATASPATASAGRRRQSNERTWIPPARGAANNRILGSARASLAPHTWVPTTRPAHANRASPVPSFGLGETWSAEPVFGGDRSVASTAP